MRQRDMQRLMLLVDRLSRVQRRAFVHRLAAQTMAMESIELVERARRRGTWSLPRALRRRTAGRRTRCRAALSVAATAIQADHGDVAAMARLAPTACERRHRDRESHRLQPEPMDGADALPRGWGRACRQQLDREPDPTDRAGALELAVRGFPARWAARRGRDEPDPVGEVERPRPISLPQGRARSAAHAAGQPDRGTAAASLDAEDSALNGIRAIGKMGWPDAYATWSIPIETGVLSSRASTATGKTSQSSISAVAFVPSSATSAGADIGRLMR